MPPTTDDPTDEIDTAALVAAWAARGTTRTATHQTEVAWAARTDMGRVRENNEDKFDFFVPEDPAQLALRGRLWAVADGMGGHNAGQIASEVALKSLIRSYFAPDAPDDVAAALRGAVRDANAIIHQAARQFEGKSGMGTTLVAVVVRDNLLTVAHVGDSRAYLLRRGEPIRPLTTDHSWVEEQVRRGALSRADAEASPYRNYILRSVGVEAQVEAEVAAPLPLQEGDTVLLCSDGLTGFLDDAALEATIAGKGLSQAALDLVDTANDRGGRDNITALLLRVGAITPVAGAGL